MVAAGAQQRRGCGAWATCKVLKAWVRQTSCTFSSFSPQHRSGFAWFRRKFARSHFLKTSHSAAERVGRNLGLLAETTAFPKMSLGRRKMAGVHNNSRLRRGFLCLFCVDKGLAPPHIVIRSQDWDRKLQRRSRVDWDDASQRNTLF